MEMADSSPRDVLAADDQRVTLSCRGGFFGGTAKARRGAPGYLRAQSWRRPGDVRRSSVGYHGDARGERPFAALEGAALEDATLDSGQLVVAVGR